MKMRTNGASLTARAAALSLASALIAGCSGSVNHVLPGSVTSSAMRVAEPAGRRHVRTLVRIRIPHRSRKRHLVHPATISPLTQSLSIAVNGGSAVVFNTTPTSPGCTTGGSGVTCTFAITAPVGTDAFTVTTYSAVGAGGTALDRGVVTVPISAGKANQVAITLGPVVTNTNDTGMGSLRYAVGSANSGDTIMFVLPSGSTIALATPIGIAGNVAIAGPGASSLTISGGGTHQIFLVTGTATISGLTLTEGKTGASNPGGAIYNIGAVTLANDVIGNSTSTVATRRAPRGRRKIDLIAHKLHPHCTTTSNEGGALYNDGTAVISGTTFSGNIIASNLTSCVEGEGAAIYNDVAGSLTSTGDTYSNNSAYAGGAIYNAGFGLVSFTGDTFSANSACNAASGCPTSGCGATSCTSYATGQGAAIDDNGLGITVVNSTFSNNVAGGATAGSSGLGGAIILETNSVLATITGSTFSNDLAGGGTSSCSGGAGGAILAVNPVELDNDTFTDNSASGDNEGLGGAVYGLADVTGTGDTFTGNTAVGSGGACTTSGEGAGGAVYAGGSTTFNTSTFGNNAATANATGAGGAIAALTNVTANASTFTSNTATSTGAGGATSNQAGGGAIVGGAIVKVTGSTFTSNAASAGGSSPAGAEGGAVVGTNAIVSTNSTYASNSVAQTSGTTGVAEGGATAIGSGTWVSNGDKFTANSVTGTAVAGAGAGIVSTGGCFISNATVTSNTASGPSGVGGGLAVGGTCTVNHVTVTGNTATATVTGMPGGGGGIYDGAGSTIENSTISGNSATNVGGGILVITHPDVISNSSVSGNAVTAASVTDAGGGGIADGAGVELFNATVANNTVTIGGVGGADGGGGIYDTSGIIAIYSTISGNKVVGSAPTSGGGGIFTTGGVLGIDDTIADNSSSVDGGGLDLAGSAAASLGNVTIFKNAATGNGGNVNIGASAGLSLINSILAGGPAGAGPDADNAGGFSSGDYNIIQTAPAGNAITGTTTHNLAVDPKLLPLANNGGPTFTHADQAAGVSPGTQYIPFSGSNCGTVSNTVDQRGFTRGAGGKCDVGAYEYAGVATAIRHRPAALPKHHFRKAGTTRFVFPRIKPLKLPTGTIPSGR
jgi:hypothetical protein